ncbi:MAG: flagellar filament capping protein FliD [bacterium]|nr:flagellar filament capping protein FliD [bacterium]
MAVQNLSGLSSGIDWQQLIDLQIELKSATLNTLSTKRSNEQRKLTSWNSIENALDTLKSAANTIATSSGFVAKATASSDSTIVSLNADETAVNANHSIIINQLARTEVEMHAGWADDDTTAVNSSGIDQTFSYIYDGDTVTITIPTGTTLEGLVGLINGDSDNSGIVASIINDGSGSATAYHLILSGESTGADYDISFNDAGTTLGPTGNEFKTATFTETQSAQNSQFRLDGVPPASWIESSSNDVSDALPGVTLHLKATTATPVSVSISQDNSTIKLRVQRFVEAYNAAVEQTKMFSSYDTETKTSGVLLGDANLATVQGNLQSIVSSAFGGMPGGSNYTSLASIGIIPSGEGELTVDSTALEDALNASISDVTALFAFTTESTNSALTHIGHTSNTVGGEYVVVATYDAGGLLDGSGTNTIGSYPATIENGNTLVGKTGSPVEGLRIFFNNPGGGPNTLNATVRIGKGAAVQFADTITRLTDDDGGTTASAIDTLNSMIESLDNRITEERDRLDEARAALSRRYTQYEQMISQLNSQMSQLKAT